ncbi:MAG: amidohydrolase family protein [Meiothermus sp.]|nr:amidohydrolase family protein [Meiothermus sp.]
MIDSHVHFIDPRRVNYPWLADPALAPINRPFLPEDLAPLLRTSGMTSAILVQTRSSLEESLEFLALAHQHPFLAGVVAWADLTSNQLGAQLETLRAAPGGDKLVGLRHQVQDEPDPQWLLRGDVRRGLEVVAEHGLAYDLLVLPHQLEAAVRTVREFPRLRFVLDHIAKPPIAAGKLEGWAGQIAELAQSPNMFCKVSGLVTEADWKDWRPQDFRPFVEHVLGCFGRDRLLFGSDWPVCLLAAEYAQVKALFEELVGLDAQTGWQNARRAYRLE